MSSDPAFLFYPGDYLRDTQCLSEKSQVAYDRLMCEHMRYISKHMINITVSKKQLNFFTKRLTDEEKEELMFVLTEINGGYQIEWVALSISKRKTYSNSRRDNRLSKIKKDMIDISQTYDYHMENENENENKDIIINIEFEKFWNLYDKKVGKVVSIKLWNKLTDEERTLIIDYIPKYKLSREKSKRRDPERFFTRRVWEDEIVDTQKTDNRGISRTHAPISDERKKEYEKL